MLMNLFHVMCMLQIYTAQEDNWLFRPGTVQHMVNDDVRLDWSISENVTRTVKNIFWTFVSTGATVCHWNPDGLTTFNQFENRVELLKDTNSGILIRNITKNDMGDYRVHIGTVAETDIATVNVFTAEELRPVLYINEKKTKFGVATLVKNLVACLYIMTTEKLSATVVIQVQEIMAVTCNNTHVCPASTALDDQMTMSQNITLRVNLICDICPAQDYIAYIVKDPEVEAEYMVPRLTLNNEKKEFGSTVDISDQEIANIIVTTWSERTATIVIYAGGYKNVTCEDTLICSLCLTFSDGYDTSETIYLNVTVLVLCERCPNTSYSFFIQKYITGIRTLSVNESNSGHITSIVVAVIMTLCVLVCAAIFFVKKRSKCNRKNVETSEPENVELLAICRDGEHSKLKGLLSKKSDVNILDNRGFSPLYYTCRDGCLQMAKKLVKCGADVNLGKRTALRAAASNNHLKVVTFLLRHGANDNIVQEEGTALYIACKNRYKEVVDAIISHYQQNIQFELGDKHYPLIAAATVGDNEIVSQLLKKGAQVDALEAGLSALYWASSNGHEVVVQNLLKLDAAFELSSQIKTAIHGAVENKHCHILELLIEKGADINILDSKGISPLYYACVEDQLNMVERLCAANASINQGSKLPIIGASEKGYDAVVKCILQKDAHSANQTNHDGFSAVYLAACKGHIKIVTELHVAGANQDLGKTSALIGAARKGHLDIVEFLINKKVNVDKLDPEKFSAIYWAARKNKLEIVRLLIGAKANTKIGAKTALHGSCLGGSLHVVKELVHNGGFEVSQIVQARDVAEEEEKTEIVHYLNGILPPA